MAKVIEIFDFDNGIIVTNLTDRPLVLKVKGGKKGEQIMIPPRAAITLTAEDETASATKPT